MSSCEAELISLCEALKEIKCLRNILGELLPGKISKPTIIYEDNQSCIALANIRKFSQRTKHFDLRYWFARECVLDLKIAKLVYLSTDNMLADQFTKPLSRQLFEKFRERMGVSEDTHQN